MIKRTQVSLNIDNVGRLWMVNGQPIAKSTHLNNDCGCLIDIIIFINQSHKIYGSIQFKHISKISCTIWAVISGNERSNGIFLPCMISMDQLFKFSFVYLNFNVVFQWKYYIHLTDLFEYEYINISHICSNIIAYDEYLFTNLSLVATMMIIVWKIAKISKTQVDHDKAFVSTFEKSNFFVLLSCLCFMCIIVFN